MFFFFSLFYAFGYITRRPRTSLYDDRRRVNERTNERAIRFASLHRVTGFKDRNGKRRDGRRVGAPRTSMRLIRLFFWAFLFRRRR